MITLPNGCYCSNLSVNPKNWQSKVAKMSKDWYIIYRFYDPKHPNPKLVMVKGMNQFKALQARQEATKTSIADEMEKLVKRAYNPFEKVRKGQTNTATLTTNTPQQRWWLVFMM